MRRRRPAGSFAISRVEDFAARRIFVAEVDVDVGRLDHIGADQHALEKAVRIGFQIDSDP